MQPETFNKLQIGISTDRIRPYILRATESRAETVARYIWNVILSESLYPAMNGLEILLRNTVHSAFSLRHGANWFGVPQLLPDVWQNEAVREATSEIQSRGKPVEPCRIVAELPFGFWTSLFGRKMEHRWHGLLKNAFPGMPGAMRQRSILADRLNTIRALRNRVFHHERILHYDLPAHHRSILDVIDWMNPESAKLVKVFDRFPAVHRGGFAECLVRMNGDL